MPRANVPEGPPPAGLRRTADRRRQRLVLVVRARARFRQPRGVRPALPQPSGQRLSLSEPQPARGAVAAHSAHGGERRARPAQRADSAGDRRRSHFVFRMDGRRALSRGRALRLHARQEVPGARGVLRQRRRESLSARGFSPRLRADHFGNGSASEHLGGRSGANPAR